MKNFTNNFKQFTSRLSARWLIMALMMLVGTSSAWAWGWVVRCVDSQSSENPTYYLGDEATFYWCFNGDGSNATFKRACISTSSSSAGTWMDNLKWVKDGCDGNDNKTWKASFLLSSTGTKYYGLWLGWGNSVGDNGRYYNGSGDWNEGYTSYSSSKFTVKDLPTPTNAKVTLSGTTASLSWTKNATYTTVMIVRYAKGATVTAPTQGTSYAVNGTIGTGKVVYKSTGATTTNTVTAGSSYDYYFYTVNNNYYSSSVKVTADGYTYPAVSTISATVDGDKLVCKGEITSMGSASTVVWAFTVLSNDNISKATTDWKYPDGQNQITAANTSFTYNIPISSLSLTKGNTYYVRAMTVDYGNLGISNNQYGNAVAGDPISFVYDPCTTPDAPTFDEIDAQCGSYTLPTEDKNKVSVNWYDSNGNKITSVTQSGTYYAEAVDGTCVSENRTDVEITIKTKPTITASKTSCAPYEVITLSSAAGPGTTWSADGGMLSATSGASVTFRAAPGTYTVTASANDCTDTKTITVACAAEDCSGAQSTDVIITCDPNGYTGDKLYCHIWPYGGQGIVDWPGTLGEKVNGIWTWTFKGLKSNTTYDLLFNNNSDKQTNDIDQNVVPGYQYNYTLNHSKWNENKAVTPKAITVTIDPIVTTVSAEQKDGEPTVVIKGFLQATGCADITKYGYQYRVSGNGDYTDVQETGGKNICEEWTLEQTDLEFGVTYDFRAKATNEGGGKGYGDVIQVTIQGQSTPVVIKAVRNDRTVNESHWADFVALYVQEDGISTAGEGATKATKYTWEYSTDGTNWSTNFTGYVLGGASATVGVTNGSEKCNNIRPTKTGKYRVKVTYDNANEQYSNIITITSDGFKLKYAELGQQKGAELTFDAASRTIPVFVVKTTENFPDCPASGMPSQDVEGQKAKKSVDVKIFDNGNVVYDRKARMNYRGSSSLNFRKKSYAFCTGKEKTKNNKGDVDTGKENLFGLSNGAKDKDWVLYAAMPDPSMMRNRLIFDTYAQMTGKWGVNSMFVELIIDDEYMGVYVLMDKITNNENRVYVGTYGDDEKKDYNGGFILKFDKTDVTDRFEDENSEKRNTFTTEKTGKSGIGSYGATFDQRFEIEYPEMEDMGTEKWVEFVNDNVKGKIEAFEKALEAGNYTEVRKLIDYESWADWFIISEFAKNVDAYRASCYFVYNGDKIEARPLWDQELSFNNTATTVGNGKGCNSTSGLLIQNSGVYSDDFPAPFWFTGGGTSITGGLLNDPCFVTMVKNRYKDHLNNALSNGQLTGKISAYQTELTDAAKTRETNTWRPSSGEITACTGGGTGYNNILISYSISTMTEWITDRPEGLTAALDELTGSSINISIEPSFVETYPWEPFTLTVDAPEGYEYEMAFTKEGADATGNMVVVKGGDIYTVKIKRPANTLSQLFKTVPYLATATLKVADDGCGGMTTPEANVNIRLNDRVEDECPQPSPGQ